MKTKRKNIYYIFAAAVMICVLVVLCIPTGLSAHALDLQTIIIGEATSGSAVYADPLDVGTVRFIASVSAADGEGVTIGLMRNANTAPSANGGERGLLFTVKNDGGEYFLDVVGVELRSTVRYVQNYKLSGGRFSAELARRTVGYRLSVNGTRIISNYSDALSALSAATFSMANKTHFAVTTGENSTVTVESVSASAQTETPAGDEWFSQTGCTAVSAGGGIAAENTSLRLGAYRNAAYTRVDLSLAAQDGEQTNLAFASSAAPPLFCEQGGNGAGVVLRFARVNGYTYLDVTHCGGGKQVKLCGNYSVGRKTDISVELKKKPSLLGYALLIDGVRLTVGGIDPLGALVKEDLGQYIDASTSGTYLSVGSDGAAAVRAVSDCGYDPYPIINEKEIENDSEYGTTADDWEGEYRVENGVLCSHSHSYLRQGLDTEYVAFNLGFAALSDSATTLDSYVAFGLASEPTATAVLPEENGGNAIFFTVSKRNGLVYLTGYSRFDGELKNFLTATALNGVQAENEMTVEFVYYDYELTLYINGSAVKTSYGSNPLDEYYSLYYENEEYLTHLCFNAYAYADARKPTLTAENCAQYRVYGIANDLPAKFIPAPALSVTESQEPQIEKFKVYKVVVPCVITFALSAAAGATAIVLLAKKRRGKDETTDK